MHNNFVQKWWCNNIVVINRRHLITMYDFFWNRYLSIYIKLSGSTDVILFTGKNEDK